MDDKKSEIIRQLQDADEATLDRILKAFRGMVRRRENAKKAESIVADARRQRWKKVFDLRNSGMTWKKIGETLSIHPKSASTMYFRYGRQELMRQRRAGQPLTDDIKRWVEDRYGEKNESK